jgi:hypothetical protein
MHVGTVFNHETVPLDGESFRDCEFRDCPLIYRGEQVPAFTDCRFHECEWRLEGSASRTLEHLQVMWTARAKPTVQSLIKEVTGAGVR